MQFKSLVFGAALLGASAVTAQTPDPNVDVSVFELRVFSNETAIDGKPIVAKNGYLSVGEPANATCSGNNAGYANTTFTEFLIGVTTYNPDGEGQLLWVDRDGQNVHVAAVGESPPDDQIPTGFRQIVHWNDKLLQFRSAGFQACPRSNSDEWIVSVQPGALPTSPECNIFDAIIVPKDAATAPRCEYY